LQQQKASEGSEMVAEHLKSELNFLLAESIIERIFLNLSPSKAWPRPKLKKNHKMKF
jgi:hypothetical protein